MAKDPFADMEKDPFALSTLLKQPKKRTPKRRKLATPSTPGKKVSRKKSAKRQKNKKARRVRKR